MHFGFDIHFSDEDVNAFIQDGWAYSQRERDFGIRMDCDRLEGWIVDPLLAVGQRDREFENKLNCKLGDCFTPCVSRCAQHEGVARNDNTITVVKYHPHAGVAKW